MLPKDYEKIVAREFGILRIFKKTRKMQYVQARVALFYFLRQYEKMKYMGMADLYRFTHGNVYYHVSNAEYRIKYDKNFREKIENCKKVIESFGDKK